MKKLHKIIATTLLAGLVIYSCKKKDDPAPAASTTTGSTTTTTGTTTSGTTTSGTTTSGTTTTGTTTSGTTTSGTTSGTTTSSTSVKTVLLINKQWGMSACTFEPPISGNFNGIPYTVGDLYDPMYALIAGCAKDDTLKFTAAAINAVSGGYTSQVNTKCSSESDAAGTWKFSTDQMQIILTNTGNSTSQTFTLLDLQDKIMKVRTIMKNPVDPTDPKDYTATITFNSK